MQIKIFKVGSLLTNCYLIEIGHQAIVIDPGFLSQSLFNFLLKRKLKLEFILLTHGHPDHVRGVFDLKRKFGGKIIGHKDLKETLLAMKNYPEISFEIENFSIDIPISENIKIKKDNIEFQILKTPGHTKDGLSFIFEKRIFCGDLLFENGIGRYDLYGGNFQKLKESILKILSFFPSCKIYPGHGSAFSVKKARENIKNWDI